MAEIEEVTEPLSPADKQAAIARKLREAVEIIATREVVNPWHLDELAEHAAKMKYLCLMATM